MHLRSANYYGTANTIDLMKWLAIVTMTIDHLYYIFPDALWLRVIGRASFPIWLLIVGYHAASQKAGSWLKWRQNTIPYFIGCALLIFADYATSRPILPINILLTIFIVQGLFISPFIRRFIDEQPLTVFVYAIIALPFLLLFEYGSQGFIFALLGYLIRKGTHPKTTNIIVLLSIAIYVAVTNITFNFSDVQQIAVAIVSAISIYWMTHTAFTSQPRLHPFICILTRNSLLYYVLHVMLLIMIGAWLHPPAAYFVFKLF